MKDFKLPSKVQFIETEGKANTADLIVEPLYPGYGTTVGNALRRVLLSSIVGSAITAVRINGVNHEFTAIAGVKEDIVEIILNLKNVRLKLHRPGPVTINLKKKGEGKVRAKDIKTIADVDVANPEQLIATITDKKAVLEMEMTVDTGRGYLPIEARGKEKAEIGELFVDAIFTPIKLVNFKVEDVRVGKLTNFDRLTMEIETDGTISPREAFDQAGKILVDHFNLFLSADTLKEAEMRQAEEKRQKQALVDKEQKDKEAKETGVLSTAVEDLSLSRRTTNALYNNDIKTIKDIVKINEEELAEMRGLGGKAVNEVKQVLRKMNLHFSGGEEGEKNPEE